MKFKISDTMFQNAGFTLLELLVAFSVMSVITGLGLASFVSISRNQTLYEAANNIKQAVDYARFNSLSVVKPKECASGELVSYTASFCYNSNPTCALPENRYMVNANCTNTSDVLLSGASLPDNITFQSPSGGSACQDVVFASVSNQNEGLPCSVVVSGYGENLNIDIDSQGYVSFSDD